MGDGWGAVLGFKTSLYDTCSYSLRMCVGLCICLSVMLFVGQVSCCNSQLLEFVNVWSQPNGGELVLLCLKRCVEIPGQASCLKFDNYCSLHVVGFSGESGH